MNIAVLGLMLFVMTFSGTLGAYFLKRSLAGQSFSVIKLIVTPSVYLGGVFYILGAVVNIFLLRFLDYSIVYPMTALTYIWTLVFSCLVLKEKITSQKIVAILFIIAGVIILNL